ncbi:MAG: response regulator transcription factor [Gammaproteobacteria bacterium]|nr:response regulator transcription factor [Gammaproteobacteria bacterium]
MISRPVRVLLAMDAGPAEAATRQRLKTIANFEIVGATGNGQDTLALVNDYRPHAVIVGISTLLMKSLETLHHIVQGHPDVRVAVLSAHTDETVIRQALRAGAVAYLDTSATAAEIEFAIRAVLHDGIYLSPRACKTFVTSCGKCVRKQPISSDLTPRQREVLQLIAEGHTTKQIAQRLHLSAKTVETHRSQLMKQLGIHEVAGLVRYAIRTGLVSPEK